MLIAPIQVTPRGTIEAFDGVLVDDSGRPAFGDRPTRWSVAGMGAIAYPGNDGLSLIRAEIMNVSVSDDEVVAVVVRGDLKGNRFRLDRTGDAIAVQLPLESVSVISNTIKPRNRKIERTAIHAGPVAVAIDPLVELSDGSAHAKVRDRQALAERLVTHVLAVNEQRARTTAVDTATLRSAGWMQVESTELEHFVNIEDYYRQLTDDGVAFEVPAGSALSTADAGGGSVPAEPDNAAAPAGWYPDRRDDARLRWWDGEAWTDHTTERPTSVG